MCHDAFRSRTNVWDYDRLYGQDGDDDLKGGDDVDWLYGGSDNDLLRGEDGDDRLYGGDGADDLKGGAGIDQLYADVGIGIDRLQGDGGADRFILSGADASDGSLNRVVDFNISDGDIVELLGGLIGYDPVNSAISDFITVTESHTIINVDRDGQAGTHTSYQVMHIENVNRGEAWFAPLGHRRDRGSFSWLTSENDGGPEEADQSQKEAEAA